MEETTNKEQDKIYKRIFDSLMAERDDLIIGMATSLAINGESYVVVKLNDNNDLDWEFEPKS